jgi:hypothetical protein
MQIEKKPKNVLFVAFLLLYTACIIYLCYELNIWEDEAYTLHTTSLKLSSVIDTSYKFEGQPPAYFLILTIWRAINFSIFFARLFSVACILGATYFFYKIISLISDKKNLKWIIAIFLLNPFTVWASLEIRLYAFLILLSVMAIFFFMSFYLGNKKRDLYIFLVIGLIGEYTQYFFTLEIAALAFSLLVFKGRKVFFTFCLYLLPLILLFLPNFSFLPEELRMHQYRIDEYSFVQRFAAVFHTPQDFLLALQLAPFDRWVRSVIKLIFILCIAYAYFKAFKNKSGNKGRNLELFNFLLLTVFFLIILYGTILVVSDVVYIHRYFAIGFPFFIVLFILYNGYSFMVSKVFFLVTSLYFVYLLITFYRPMVKDYDYKNIATYVKSIEQKKEPILFYNSILSLPFMYYYKGTNAVAPLPENVVFDSTYQKNIKDTIQLQHLFTKISSLGSDSYLLITDDLTPIGLKINMNRTMFDDYLNKKYITSLDTLYFGRSLKRYLRVRRLEIKKDTE